MSPGKNRKTFWLFPFSVCSLYFDASRTVSFSSKSSNYNRICINVWDSFSFSRKECFIISVRKECFINVRKECFISVESWALSENVPKLYIQILSYWFVLFSSPRTQTISWVILHLPSCPSCSIQSSFWHFCLFSFYFALFFQVCPPCLRLYFYQCLFSFVQIQCHFYY